MSLDVPPTSAGSAANTQKAFALRVSVALSLTVAVACVIEGCATTTAPSANAAHASVDLAQTLGLPPSGVTPSPLPGVFMIDNDHTFGYVSADGRYLLRGDLLDRTTDRDLTDDARRADRLAAVESMDAITFAPPPPVATKYVVTVFTDLDCGYCRRFHSQIHDYNAEGVAVRYLAWPRSGPDSESGLRADAVWCAKDRAAALTAAKLGKPVSVDHCDSAVAAEYELGVEFGVHGTPTMVLPDGSLVAGYLSPDQLLAKLEAASAPRTGAAPATKAAAGH